MLTFKTSYSLLLVPGHQGQFFLSEQTYNAKGIILDLEDSVPISEQGVKYNTFSANYFTIKQLQKEFY